MSSNDETWPIERIRTELAAAGIDMGSSKIVGRLLKQWADTVADNAALWEALRGSGCAQCQSTWPTGDLHHVCKRCQVLEAGMAGHPGQRLINELDQVKAIITQAHKLLFAARFAASLGFNGEPQLLEAMELLAPKETK